MATMASRSARMASSTFTLVTYAEIIITSINLLMAEAAMELGCFMVVATLADKQYVAQGLYGISQG